MVKDVKKKICLLGDGAVGKTSLIKRFVDNAFEDEYVTTIGTRLSKKEVFTVYSEEKYNITLMIWDIMGQPGFRDLLKTAYLSNAEGGIVVCDVTNKNSLRDLHAWIEMVNSVVEDIPLVFLANKADLKNKAEFGIWDLEEAVKKFGDHKCMQSSAKTGENVEEAFNYLAEMIIK
jgi:small GTP-binding protein